MNDHRVDDEHRFGAPPALLSIARAAWLVGDRDLERAARAELAERFGIELKFKRRPRQEAAGAR
jgi:hypothetical protein